MTLKAQMVSYKGLWYGCDYISFFSGISKATFLRCFYQYAEFISSGLGNTPGTLSDVNLEQDNFNTGFLAFLRLVGVVYFKKYALAFSSTTPVIHFNTFNNHRTNPLEQHQKWLEDVRQNIWDRTLFENEMIPSTDALYRHWKRSCWIINMWHQANCSQMVLKPLSLYGWKVIDNSLTIDWDSAENMAAVQQRVESLTRGCKCRTGCRTLRCGCRKQGRQCTEGCECTSCVNIEIELATGPQNEDSLLDVTLEELVTEGGECLTDNVDEIMDWVFGDHEIHSDESDNDLVK